MQSLKVQNIVTFLVLKLVVVIEQLLPNRTDIFNLLFHILNFHIRHHTGSRERISDRTLVLSF